MLLDLFLVIVLAWAAGALVGRLGYPPVLGELAAGVVLGPPALGWVGPSDALAVLATIGVILLMLLAGLRADPRDVARHAPGALLPALAGLAIPMALGYGVVVTVAGGTPEAGLMVGVILGVTALATVSRVLIDLDMLATRIGQRLLCVSLLEVILVLVAFAVVNGAVGGGEEPLAWVVAKAAGFLALAALLGLYGLTPLARALARGGLLGRPGAFTLVLAVGLGYAAASEAAGLTFVPGAFLAGLFLSREALAGTFDGTVEAVRDAGLGFLTPVFFFSAGFAADLGVLAEQPVLVASVVAAGVGGKILAGIGGLALTGGSWREGAVLGAGMNGRGGIDVILAGAALSGGVIGADLFTALVITTFAATLPVPVLLQAGQRWLASGDASPSPAPEPPEAGGRR
jgi:Kef-type K+ transport system membrane component KefB